VYKLLRKDIECWGVDAVPFVPDGWYVNSARHEFCLLEIENTNPISERKRDAICRWMWWLDDYMWHLHLFRVSAQTQAFFFMNCDDIAAWDMSKHPARQWHCEESLLGIKG